MIQINEFLLHPHQGVLANALCDQVVDGDQAWLRGGYSQTVLGFNYHCVSATYQIRCE
jgi:hypothetical protein